MSTLHTDAKPAIAFVADPKADIILESSDGVPFPIRRVHLQSSCEVFDGMLSAATGHDDEKDKKTGLTVVKLEDKASELDIFLRFIDRDQIRRSVSGEPLALEETKSYVPQAQLCRATGVI